MSPPFEETVGKPSGDSGSWLERARRLFPGGAINVLRLPADEQFVVVRGEGAYVWDERGRSYVDVVLGSGPLILGHAHPTVQAAVKRQIEQGSTYYNVNRPAIELAEAILEAFPGAQRVRFASGGSDATYLAMRLARAATGRNKVLKFEGAFHGFHDMSMMSLSPTEPTAFPRGVPSSGGVSEGTYGDVLVAPFNDEKTTTAIVRAHAEDLAAIMVEPIQRDIPPLPGFLPALRRLADETGALLIMDEVVTGFRFRYGGVQDMFGVRGDLTCLGKIVGGGLPLAAVVGPAGIMDLCVSVGPGGAGALSAAAPRQPVYFSGTLSGNPLSAAAGLATLNVLREPGVYEHLEAIGTRVRSGLDEALTAAGVRGVVTGFGSMFHVHFVDGPVHSYRDVLRGNRQAVAELHVGMLRRGVFVNPGAKSYLSAAHSDAEVRRIVDAFADALSDVAARHLTA